MSDKREKSSDNEMTFFEHIEALRPHLVRGVMALIVLWDGMPLWLSVVLVTIVAVLMLFAFFNYMKVYCRIRKNPVEQDKPEEPGASS